MEYQTVLNARGISIKTPQASKNNTLASFKPSLAGLTTLPNTGFHKWAVFNIVNATAYTGKITLSATGSGGKNCSAEYSVGAAERMRHLQ
jgi:hypothetical protein